MKQAGAALLFCAALLLYSAAGPGVEAPRPLRDAPGELRAMSAADIAASGVPAPPSVPAAAPCAFPRPEARLSRQVSAFVEENGDDFALYTPSCASLEACPLSDGFREHEKVYAVQGSLDEVFARFTAQDPRLAWRGSSRFELMYDKASGRAYTKSAPSIPAIGPGQVFFLTLHLPLGLKMPVVFEPVLLDKAGRRFAFSYVKQNKSNGIQHIAFTQNGAMVEIRHTTHYRSASGFRDKHLYAPFHEMLTDDFYADFFESLRSPPPAPCL